MDEVLVGRDPERMEDEELRERVECTTVLLSETTGCTRQQPPNLNKSSGCFV